MKKILPIVAGVVVLVLLTSKASGQIILSASGLRGIRNKNPGNIRIPRDKEGNLIDQGWMGRVPHSLNTDPYKTFEQFTEMKWGARAMLKILKNYLEMYGLNTIPEIIARWAPLGDGKNDPAKYAGYVSERTGIGMNQIVSTVYPDAICMIASAIAEYENGKSEAMAAGLSPQFFKMAWGLI